MCKALWLAAASVMVLSACSERAEHSDETVNMERVEPAPTEAADAAAPQTTETGPARTSPRLAVREAAPNADARPAPAPPTLAPPPRTALPAPIARIAYAFSYQMSVPRDRGAELMSRHELTCAAAGAGYCQVVSAQADWTAREPGGRLELRGQPEWINQFRATLALDAQNAGGRLDTAATDGEDVTRGLDTAATRAATTASLAARIRELQNRQGGTMAQRLEVERQLADLQRRYDDQQLALRALTDRVQSARLTLTYREGGVMAADSPTRPVAGALRDAFGLSMSMLAVLITVGSVMLPVVAIGGVVWWAAVRRRRKPAAA